MKITVNQQIHLSEFQSSDQATCVEHLKEKEIYDRTLRIPYPYTEADFQEWLKIVEKDDSRPGASGPMGDQERGWFPHRGVRIRRFSGRQIAPGRNRLLAGEAVLGPWYHDRRGVPGLRVCFFGVWSGEDHGPCFCQQPGFGSGAGKMRLCPGGLSAQALLQGRPLPRRQVVRLAETEGAT